MNINRYALALGAALLIPVCANAGFLDIFNPKVEVTIDHPPGLPLKISAVAIAKPEGQCGDEVGSRVEEDFVQSGVPVIDRQRLQEVLSEFKLQSQTMIDQKTAAKVGNLLGAQALLFIKVLDCRTGNRQDHYTDKKGRTSYTYYTSGVISGSMRVIDLTTGRVVAAQHFEGKDEKHDGDGYPDKGAVLGNVERDVSTSIHQMLLPWSEKKQLVFYDDKECDLAQATHMLKARDLEGARKQSESNVTACLENPKAKVSTRARAYYNLGVVQFVQRDYDAALASLAEATKIQGSKTIDETTAQFREAKRNAEILAASLAAPAAEPAPAPKPTPGGKGSLLSSVKNKPDAEGAGASVARTPEERLAKLKSLLDRKLITQKEFDEKRAEILKDL